MIKREVYLSKIRPFYDTDLIKVLVGIRRCGKSVILQQIIEELKENGVKDNNIIYLNFELLDYSHIKTETDLFNYVKSQIKNKKKYYLFFDEIQEVENFEKAISSFKAGLNVSVFVTGSNAKLLSGEFATYLSGRYVQFKIMPFSYLEVKKLKEKNKQEFNEKTFFDYLKWGGMPQRFIFKNENEIAIYLKDLYDSIILKDIVQRANIRNVNILNNIVQFMLENIGKTFSGNSIINYLKNEKRQISNEALYGYLEHIVSSMVFNRVNRYHIKGKKVLSTFEKYYVADLGIKSIKKAEVSSNLGTSLENIVYNELIVRGYNVYVGNIDGDLEVDFIATKENEKKYFQVTYLLSDEKVVNREFGVYKNIKDNYQKYVLSLDKIDLSRDGIIHRNVIDFLLEED